MSTVFWRRRPAPDSNHMIRCLDAVMESAASPLVRVETDARGAVKALVVETGPIARRHRRAITRDIAVLARPLRVKTVHAHGATGRSLVAVRAGLAKARRLENACDPFFADLEHVAALAAADRARDE